MSRYSVPDMSCGHCKASIENAVLDADPGAELTFDMDAREVEVDTTLDKTALLATLKEAGYPATELG